MFMDIKNKNILITGSNRGIGLAFTHMVAREGAHLQLVVRKKDESFESQLKNELINEGAASVQFRIADLSLRSDVDRLLNELKNESIDILFNNAGLLTGGLLEEQTVDDIYKMLQVNVSSLIHLTNGLLPQMLQRKTGKIINNSSVSAFMHFPCSSTYSASKAAVVAFSNCLHAELRGTGVSVLCLITPGIKTRMFDEIETKFGKNFEVPTDAMSPDKYALQVKKAIQSDAAYLTPKGTTGVGLFIAKHMPSLFIRAAQTQFHR